MKALSLTSSWYRALQAEFGHCQPHLMELLSWVVCGAFSRADRRLFPLQIVWTVGSSLDSFMQSITQDGGAQDQDVSMKPVDEHADQPKMVSMYQQAVMETARLDGCSFMSATVDKSRVQSHGLLNGVYALPSNIAWWGAPQDRSMVAHETPPAYPQDRRSTIFYKTNVVLGGAIVPLPPPEKILYFTEFPARANQGTPRTSAVSL